jgi:hypothetical protein
MELRQGTRVRFTATELGGIAKDGAFGNRFVGGATWRAGELGTVEVALPTALGDYWYAITPDRQPVYGVEVYVPAHVSMFELVDDEGAV